MRTLTTPQSTALASANYWNNVKLEIQDAAATWQDWSSWLEHGTISADIDAPVGQLTVNLRRDDGSSASLSPMRGDSSLNSGGAALDAGRGIRLSIATTAFGTAPTSGDYVLWWQGVIDKVDFEKSPLQITARDLGAQLVDRWVETAKTYGSSSGIAMETVIQSILTDWVGGVTLYTPSSPSYLVKAWLQSQQSVMDALQALAAGLIGWDIEYLYDEGTSAFRLTLFQPDRAKTAADWTFGASDYFDVKKLSIDRTNIRNAITVAWLDPATGVASLTPATAADSASITRYGRRWMQLSNALIRSSTDAQNLANAALADLKEPKAEQEIENLLFWPIQLGDLYTWTANGVHYSADQKLAVIGFQHEFGSNIERTTIRVRGSVAGFYRRWVRDGVGSETPTVAPPTSLVLTSNSSTALATQDGAYVPRIQAVWVASTDADIDHYDVAYKKHADTDWLPAPPVPGNRLVTFIAPVTNGVSYDVEVRAVNTDGFVSAWVSATITTSTQAGTGGTLRAPSLRIDIPQSGSPRVATVTITDPDKVVSANPQFAVKVGSAAFGSFGTGWASSTGVAGVDTTLVRTANITLSPSHNSEIEVRYSYVLGGVTFIAGGARTVDVDATANIEDFDIEFDSSNHVLVKNINVDDDTATAYCLVTTDGSTPADPTISSNSGSTSSFPGSITTSIVCAVGDTAKVKVRGAGGGLYGPSLQKELVNTGTLAAVSSASAKGGASGTADSPSSANATNLVSCICTGPSGSYVVMESFRAIDGDEFDYSSPFNTSGSLGLTVTDHVVYLGGYKHSGANDYWHFQHRVLLYDGGSNLIASAFANQVDRLITIVI